MLLKGQCQIVEQRMWSCVNEPDVLRLCTGTRWGHNFVQSNHPGQHTNGAVHEGHGHTLRPSRPQRHDSQDHGEQTVLRGTRPANGFVSHTQLYIVYMYLCCVYHFVVTHNWMFVVLSWILPNWRGTRMWTWTWLISSTFCRSWWRKFSWLLRSYRRKHRHTHTSVFVSQTTM